MNAKSNNVPADPAGLFRLAQAITTRMAEQHEGLRMAEARLHAAIAWAKFARDSHIAIVEHAKQSPKARAFVEQAQVLAAPLLIHAAVSVPRTKL